MNNALKYVKILESTGVSREQAEAHVQIISEFLEADLATKQDLLNFETRQKVSTDHLENSILILDSKLIASVDRLDAKIDSLFGKLDHKINTSVERLDTKIDDLALRLDTKIDDAVEKLEHKILQSEYRMTIRLGSMITIVIATATAIIKLF
jgi:hypothetical protein